MLTIYDYLENQKYELENTKEIKQQDIRNKFKESNLKFILTGNRMSGESCTFLFYKNKKIEVCYIEDLDDDFSDIFPIAYSIEYNNNQNNNKYDFYECGYGSLLFVDKKINNDFYNELIKLAKEKDVEFYDNMPDEGFIYSYWITIAKIVLKKH